jgi:hypothetical protein
MFSFWSEHTYYKDMILNWKNWGLVLSAGISALLPFIAINKQKFSIKNLLFTTG